jgi:thiamine-phosphate pyrophosphorylase
VFETPSKKQYGDPQGLDTLAKITSSVAVPVFAIGGVTPENAAECIAAGAHGVASVGAVMKADDVTGVLSRFRSAIGTL